MPIECIPVKDEPEHRVNDEHAKGARMSGKFAKPCKPMPDSVHSISHLTLDG
jgi:hypothetical protein